MMNKKAQLLILLTFFTLGIKAGTKPFGITFTPSASEIATYQYVEVVLKLKKAVAVNPFTEVEIKGQLTTPSGKTIKVDGFCDSPDGKLSKIRFMATEAGQYMYDIGFTCKSQTEMFSGTFTAKPSANKGLIKVDEQYPYHFIYQGTGEHYFWNGTTTYFLLGWQNDSDMFNCINRFDSLKINRLRLTICGRVKSGKIWGEPAIENNSNFKMLLSPWITKNPDSIANPIYDVTRFNIDHWQKCERLIKYALTKNIAISVIFYLDGSRKGADPFGFELAGNADEKRYYQYAISRLAAYPNVMWDISNEFRLLRSDEWAEQMGTFVKTIDPYQHITSVHGFPYFLFRKSGWADIAFYQEWDNAGGYGFMIANRNEQEHTGRPIPQINEEYGYEEHYPSFSFDKICSPGRDADNRRRLAWRIYMAGGYQTTGESAKSGGENAGGWINGKSNNNNLLNGLAAIRKIFETTEWWKMNPDLSIVNHGGYCLAEKGKQYLLYVVWGNVKLNFDKGKYKVIVYNASNAQVIEETTVEGSTYTKSFAKWENDYAIYIKNIE